MLDACYNRAHGNSSDRSRRDLAAAARRHARVSGALERALQEQHRIGLSEFEVLEQLAADEDEHCRMQQLAG